MRTTEFLFATCQVGAEAALKAEVDRDHAELRFAYSRPGFVTFKFVAAHLPVQHFRLRSVFARARGFSLGKVRGDSAAERAAAVRELFRHRPVAALHVWERDHASPKEEIPIGRTERAIEAEALLRTDDWPSTAASDAIADCVLVEPDEWWAGWHIAHEVTDRWPGGQLLEPMPEHAVSRGYLKMREMLLWSQMPARPGDTWVEFGSAPGGASQQLLERGMHVVGIDPAEMHPAVLAHPHFTHIRARPRELKRRQFAGIRWLASDINLPPAYTLDTLEELVGHRSIDLHGMLLTLKLPDWTLAEEIPEYLDRVRSWGYPHVRARQLHYNRQEICVAARR
jgi:23S rRNA (cytidine2498-2'-O)-methyltransferase